MAKKKGAKAARSKRPKSIAGRRMDVYRAVRWGNPKEQGVAQRKLVAAEKAQAATAGWERMKAAVDSRSLDVIRKLVRSGISPGVRSHYGEFPLDRAAFVGAADVAELLLDLGADVNQMNFEGATALHTAAFKGRLRILRLLLAHGARPDIVSQFGETPRRRAEKAGHVEAESLLASAGSSSAPGPA